LPLAAARRLDSPIALLPVGKGQVKIVGKDRRSMFRTPQERAADLNDTLTTLASGYHSPLMPPGEVSRRLEGLPLSSALVNWLVDPETPGQEALAAVAEKLGVRRAIRIQVTDTCGHDDGFGAYPYPVGVCWWSGDVEVTAELWDLCPPRKVACATKVASYWGSFGNVPFGLVGHWVWRPFRAAANQATRQALTELLPPTDGDGVPPDGQTAPSSAAASGAPPTPSAQPHGS
jgi:hypothetical protein